MYWLQQQDKKPVIAKVTQERNRPQKRTYALTAYTETEESKQDPQMSQENIRATQREIESSYDNIEQLAKVFNMNGTLSFLSILLRSNDTY